MGEIVSGTALAEKEIADLQESFAAHRQPLTLSIITCDPNRATRSYLALKERMAQRLGVKVRLSELPRGATTEAVLSTIAAAASESEGVIVQLPLPAHIDVDQVLAAIPPSHDVDAFSYTGEETTVLPPVVGAIDVIARRYNLSWSGKQVVVLGAGRLVGSPATLFATTAGAQVTVLTDSSAWSTKERAHIIRMADIIILGVGHARLLTVDMIKDGAIVFDAGTSEDGGVLVGDADPAVADRAALFTPVPGGIGPLTVVVLFRNLLDLARRQ